MLAQDTMLEKAISMEEECERFYREGMERVQSEQVREFLKSMAQEQASQVRFLKRHRGKSESLLIAPAPEDFGISEEMTEEEMSILADSSLESAVALAMKRRQSAMDTYEQWMEETSDINEKNLFRELRNMKQQQKARLEQMYNQIAFNEVW